MLRRLVIRTGILALCVTAILWVVDNAVLVAGTHHGWSLNPAVVSDRDIAWWQYHKGTLPPETHDLIRPPPPVSGRPGAWYYRGGGDGGAAAPLNWAPGGPPQRFVAYDIETHPIDIEPKPYVRRLVASLIHGRALSASSGETGVRVGVALPFVMRERYYFGPLGTGAGMPNALSLEWQSRIDFSKMVLNVLIVSAIVGSPFYLCDIRAIVRRMRRRCTQCGYDLRGHDHERCPECGAQ